MLATLGLTILFLIGVGMTWVGARRHLRTGVEDGGGERTMIVASLVLTLFVGVVIVVTSVGHSEIAGYWRYSQSLPHND